jgi:hypothetical protein
VARTRGGPTATSGGRLSASFGARWPAGKEDRDNEHGKIQKRGDIQRQHHEPPPWNLFPNATPLRRNGARSASFDPGMLKQSLRMKAACVWLPRRPRYNARPGAITVHGSRRGGSRASGAPLPRTARPVYCAA